jgi:hypothetical protein
MRASRKAEGEREKSWIGGGRRRDGEQIVVER